MAKYIKLEDAIHNLNMVVVGRTEYTEKMKADLFFAIDNLPTIDIVHCGECKHRQEDIGMGDHRWCDIVNGSRRSDDFCSYGERIEE